MKVYKRKDEIDKALVKLLLDELKIWRKGTGIARGVRKARCFEFVEYVSERYREKAVTDVIQAFNYILKNSGLVTISRSGYYKWKNRKSDSVDSEIDALRRRINNSKKLFRVEINLDIKKGERREIEKVFNDIECGNTDFEHNKIPPKDYFVARYIYFRLSKYGGRSKLDALRLVLGASNGKEIPDVGDTLNQVVSQLDSYLDRFFQKKLHARDGVLTIDMENYERLISDFLSNIVIEIG